MPIVTPSVPKQNGTSGSVELRVSLVIPMMAYRHVLLPSCHGVITFAVDVMPSFEYHVTVVAMSPIVPDALPYIGVRPSAHVPPARTATVVAIKHLFIVRSSLVVPLTDNDHEAFLHPGGRVGHEAFGGVCLGVLLDAAGVAMKFGGLQGG